MFEIVVLGCFASVCVGMVAMMFCLVFGETETFKAIDEKVAEIIRGKECRFFDGEQNETK